MNETLYPWKLIRYSDHKHSPHQHHCLLWSSGFQRGGERHPPIPGTLTINSTEEELQGLRVKESCMNMNRLVTATALWYHLQVPTKNSQQKHFFCTSSLRGGHDGSLPFVTYQAKQHYISSFFPPRQENLEGYFFLLPINTLSWHLFVFYIIACCWWRSSL